VEIEVPGYPGSKVQVSLTATTNQFLGCHSNCLAALTLSAPAVVSLGNVEKKYVLADNYLGTTTLIGEPSAALKKYIAENEDARDKLFDEFKNGFRVYSLVLMSCPCNTETELPAKTNNNHGALSVAGFATWLRKKGEFLVASPLVTNQNHQTSNFSLLRAWIWVPNHSNQNVRHIEGTEYVSGKMATGLPFEEWKKHYRKFHKEWPLYRWKSTDTGQLNDFQIEDLYG